MGKHRKIERWKTIPHTGGEYLVSNFGVVKSLKFDKERILKPSVDKKGYERINVFSKDGTQINCLIHRLVAKAFIPNPLKKKEVNHIDEDKRNNHVNNLEWCTSFENHRHSHKGEKHPQSKLTDSEVEEIRSKYVKGSKDYNLKTLAKMYQVGQTQISRIVNQEQRYYE